MNVEVGSRIVDSKMTCVCNVHTCYKSLRKTQLQLTRIIQTLFTREYTLHIFRPTSYMCEEVCDWFETKISVLL